MNTNSNTYTVIYSIILVVVVAAVLAFAAMFLKPMQEANVKKDTISQILTAATVNGEDILATYKHEIESAILVNINGDKVGDLDIASCEVYDNSALKRQIAAEEKALPVYIFKNGITVIPCYGAGLWGPIWGYIGFGKDHNTIQAVCFGHKGETPGLGAKIADEPWFAESFVGKKVGYGDVLFEIVKPGNSTNPQSSVDAISGATITSQALGNTLNQWFGFYKSYLDKNIPSVVEE
jgi:Na+-transporting NADH:ubiquinone oxidoreductase subunit C